MSHWFHFLFWVSIEFFRVSVNFCGGLLSSHAKVLDRDFHIKRRCQVNSLMMLKYAGSSSNWESASESEIERLIKRREGGLFD